MPFPPKSIPGIQQQLLDWYERNKRDLPWRKTRDPYAIWVSEVMLQQTQVATVIPYYERFLVEFPNVHRLAATNLQHVLKLWEGLGYYARARNLHKSTKIVCSMHDGLIPGEWALFRALPGVGDYIASAVLSIAFEQPYAVVDGNVKRVLARLLRLKVPVNAPRFHTEFKSAAQRLLKTGAAGTFNQAIMELGALVCTPRNPNCNQCPLEDHCLARAGGKVAQYPHRLARRAVPQYRIAVGVVIKKGNLLITQRKAEGLLGGLWEFPGGKIKREESAADAVVREIKEEVNLTVKVKQKLTRVKHAYTHFKIDMDVFICDYEGGRIKLNGPVDFRWIRPSGIDLYPLPRANHKFLPALKKTLVDNGI